MRSLIILSLSVLIIACTSSHDEKQYDAPVRISKAGIEASGAFFTKNEKDKPVLVWTESLENDEGHIVKYSIWDESNFRFGNTKTVSSSAGCRAHGESMNKIAFKNDGTVICVFAKRKPTPENRFAGALYYTSSTDGGEHWSKPSFLHVGETREGLSRSFFDIATLADGEVAAIWLDSRLTQKRGDGSSLYFAKTNKQNIFATDKPIGTSTCECCRTELFVAPNGDMHALYRDIWQDSIRDMSIVTSIDNGETFSVPSKMIDDNWVIRGCPHTGPSMAYTPNELHSIWYTMGGGSGIYYSKSIDNGKNFTRNTLLTAKGKHPQVISTSNDLIIFLWEESNITNQETHEGHQHANTHKKTISLDLNKDNHTYVKAQIWQEGSPISEHWISKKNKNASFAVGTQLSKNTIGIAWQQSSSEESQGIYFRCLEL